MKRFFMTIKFLVLLVVVVTLVAWPGTVSVTWNGLHIEVQALLAVVLLAFLFYLLFLPQRLSASLRHHVRMRRLKKENATLKEGQAALTRAAVAMASGEGRTSLLEAQRAEQLLSSAPLATWYVARGARHVGDEEQERRAVTRLATEEGAPFLSLRARIDAACAQGHTLGALHLLQEALTLRPQAPWVLNTLLTLQRKQQDWPSVLSTLEKCRKAGALEPSEVRLLEAQALTQKALSLPPGEEALMAAALAYKKDPSARAALVYADLLDGKGHKAKARRVLASAWSKSPSYELSSGYGQMLEDVKPLERVKRIEAFVAPHAEHPDARLTLAEAALKARLWGEARHYLEPLLSQPSLKICTMMADIERACHNEHMAQRWEEQHRELLLSGGDVGGEGRH